MSNDTFFLNTGNTLQDQQLQYCEGINHLPAPSARSIAAPIAPTALVTPVSKVRQPLLDKTNWSSFRYNENSIDKQKPLWRKPKQFSNTRQVFNKSKVKPYSEEIDKLGDQALVKRVDSDKLDYNKRLEDVIYTILSSPSRELTLDNAHAKAHSNTPIYLHPHTQSPKSKFTFTSTREAANDFNYLFTKDSSPSCVPNRLDTSILPSRERQVFPFVKFNAMQSKCFQCVYGTSFNCVLSSPTGSGKTVIFELAILREMISLHDQGCTNGDDAKALYLAPTKALCSERQADWSKKFAPLGLTVGMLTGDTSYKETDHVRKSKIIISTPEKWDIITRKWRDYKKLFGLVKLLLVDEVHILKETRGSTLEVVITRMKRICEGMRILAISATVANAYDISKWIGLGGNDDSTACGEFDQLTRLANTAVTFNFGEEYRAVKLEQFVCGFKPQSENDFSFDVLLNSKLNEIINKYSRNKPVLIFCPTRNSCQQTAKYLKENLNIKLSYSNELKLKDRDLQACVNKFGIGYHHAGLALADRNQVETSFLNGRIKILCCTSTLAVGINLPAYLVIIKGTRCWSENRFKEYQETDILQMIGRAGRPQFENKGVAVVMTNAKLKQKYEKVINGTEKVESSLHLSFPENLVSEIAIGNVRSLKDALNWIKTTYFYVRFLANPNYYHTIPQPSMSAEENLLAFCRTNAQSLVCEKLITDEYKCTPYGFSMTMHYISFETMKLLIKARSQLSISELLDLLSQSKEFADIKLKHQEKRLYREINNSPILRYQSNSTNMTHHDKVKLLIQFELGGLDFPNYNGAMKLHASFLGDKFFVFKYILRIMTATLDVFVERKDAVSLRSLSYLLRCLHGKCWEGSPNELRQLEGVGSVAVKKFVNHNILSLKDAKCLSSSQIEYFLSLKTGAGNRIKKSIMLIPSIYLQVELLKLCLAPSRTAIDCTFLITFEVHSMSSSWRNQMMYAQIISEIGGTLLDFRRIPVQKLMGPRKFELSLRIEKLSHAFNCQVSIDSIASAQVSQSLKIEPPMDILKGFIEVIDDFEFSPLLLLLPLLLPLPLQLVVEEVNENESGSKDRIGYTMGLNKSVASNDLKLDKDCRNRDDFSEKQANARKDGYYGSTLRVLRSNGNYECNHSCKNKLRCRHICCKEGIPPNCFKHKKTEIVPMKQAPSTNSCEMFETAYKEHIKKEDGLCRNSDDLYLNLKSNRAANNLLGVLKTNDMMHPIFSGKKENEPLILGSSFFLSSSPNEALVDAPIEVTSSKQTQTNVVRKKSETKKRSIFDLSSTPDLETTSPAFQKTIFSPQKRARHFLFEVGDDHSESHKSTIIKNITSFNDNGGDKNKEDSQYKSFIGSSVKNDKIEKIEKIDKIEKIEKIDKIESSQRSKSLLFADFETVEGVTSKEFENHRKTNHIPSEVESDSAYLNL